MHPREAFSRRLELRVRAIVRDELASAGALGDLPQGPPGPVDNSVDNSSPVGGDIEGGRFTVESGVSPPLTNPLIRELVRVHGGQPRARITELELLRGYGLDLEELEER